MQLHRHTHQACNSLCTSSEVQTRWTWDHNDCNTQAGRLPGGACLHVLGHERSDQVAVRVVACSIGAPERFVSHEMQGQRKGSAFAEPPSVSSGHRVQARCTCTPSAAGRKKLAPAASPELRVCGWCCTRTTLHAAVATGGTYDEVGLLAQLLFQGNRSVIGELLQVRPHIKPGQSIIFECEWVDKNSRWGI